MKADISCKHGEPYWDRKRIHICSQRNARSFATAKCGNNAMFGKWVLIRYVQSIQLFPALWTLHITSSGASSGRPSISLFAKSIGSPDIGHLRRVLVLDSVYFSSGILCKSLCTSGCSFKAAASEVSSYMKRLQAHLLIRCIHGKLDAISSYTSSN